MSLREIEERHHNAERSGYNANAFGKQAHADRAFLLAEVARLKALCGRAATHWDDYRGTTTVALEKILAELKEASK